MPSAPLTPSPLDRLIQILARLPGLGPRSARRAALHLVKRREALMLPLRQSLDEVLESVATCSRCGNFDSRDPCAICRDPQRDAQQICVIADVADLWALERTASYRGRYHVLGGELSALDGIGPEQLAIPGLLARIAEDQVGEVILALGATIEGQTTAHYLADRLAGLGIALSRLAHGVPVGGELDHLDDGTLIQALKSRQRIA